MAGTNGNEFWERQQELMKEMSSTVEVATNQNKDTFEARRNAVLQDTVLFTVLTSSLLWLFQSNPFVSFSYICGSLFGLAYSYGLAKYVESIGGYVVDSEALRGAGVGQARFAFLILLFIFVGKFRSYGFLEIPSILGFFTYQLASLTQGLREFYD